MIWAIVVIAILMLILLGSSDNQKRSQQNDATESNTSGQTAKDTTEGTKDLIRQNTVPGFSLEIRYSSKAPVKKPTSSSCKFTHHDVYHSLGRTKQDDFIVIDCETTGLNPQDDAIIEIGAVKFSGGQEIDSMGTLINPGMHIPWQATQVNHITDNMVRNAPKIGLVLPTLIEFIGDCKTLVAHNARFDMQFIGNTMKKLGYEADYSYIDTLPLCKKQFPELPNHKLITVANHLGLSGDWHRAVDDARATGKIALQCISTIESMKQEEYSAEELICIDTVKQILIANGKRWDLAACFHTGQFLDIWYVGQPVIRIRMGIRKKYVILNLDEEEISRYSLTFSTDTAPKSGPKSYSDKLRIYVQGPDDIQKLDELILRCLAEATTAYERDAQHGDERHAIVI